MNPLKGSMKRLLVGAVATSIATLGVGLAGVSEAHAAGVFVADCSVAGLKRALTGAIADRSGPESVVVLAPRCTYTLTQPDNIDPELGPNGLPVIAAHNVRIQGFGATIQRDPRRAAPEFRVFSVRGGGLTMEDLTVANGDAGLNGGGGVLVQSGALNLSRVMIYHNTAAVGGGIHVTDTAPEGVNIVNSTLYTNVADITESTVYQDDWHRGRLVQYANMRQQGGAIFVEGATQLTIDSSTIALNRSGGEGGGLAILPSLPTNVRNSIILANPASGSQFDGSCYGVWIPGADRNLFRENGNCTSINALYVPNSSAFTTVLNYASNVGGSTSALAPRPGSPAINNGSCTQPRDQRNAPRPSPAVGGCDLGSVEIQP